MSLLSIYSQIFYLLEDQANQYIRFLMQQSWSNLNNIPTLPSVIDCNKDSNLDGDFGEQHIAWQLLVRKRQLFAWIQCLRINPLMLKNKLQNNNKKIPKIVVQGVPYIWIATKVKKSAEWPCFSSQTPGLFSIYVVPENLCIFSSSFIWRLIKTIFCRNSAANK